MKKPALVLLVLLLGAAGAVMAPGSHVPRASAASASALKCGSWRWAVKTLSDTRTSRVHFLPRDRSVGFLRTINGPGSANLWSWTPRIVNGPETQVYRVKVALLRAVVEDDRDIHLVVAPAKAKAKTMIVELPNTACQGAAGSKHHAQMAAARHALLAACPPIGSSAVDLTGSATITGVGFFDDMHGQTGAAPNGLELHPALSFAGTCQKASSGGGGGGGGGGGDCSPSYPTVCIPPPPPDLNCSDVKYTNFKVVPPDPHGFDGDNDGVGCET
jgi:hypothetical protein